MLVKMSDLNGCSIRATDGEIGSVHDVYFDADTWTVRYLVVDAGTWLTGRRVLVSPRAVRGADPGSRHLDVALARQQVENSPDVDTARPVSRQHEIEFAEYYEYPYYWGGPFRWGFEPYPGALASPRRRSAVEEEIRARERENADPHLHSGREVIGYYLEASDGDLGHVEDFLVDDLSWAIRYMVVDTRNWLPGKTVLVSPEWIRDVSWADSKVRVDLTRASVERAPEYDPSRPLERDAERRLHEHYGLGTYWDREAPPAA
ncbi:MAG TPA: PRC-barrel domain-containing protein [Methylomirabilota bacterium]|nr:PRC-barrel domain-containing protein [Methylomirabilota bacterium]